MSKILQRRLPFWAVLAFAVVAGLSLAAPEKAPPIEARDRVIEHDILLSGTYRVQRIGPLSDLEGIDPDQPAEGKREPLLREGGGNTRSHSAALHGLRWLAKHQGDDGRWSIHGFPKCAPGCTCTGIGSRVDDVAATAYALLPFLGAGITHNAAKPDRFGVLTVQRGLIFLLAHQKEDGSFPGGIRTHALATLALCEAYGISNDGALKAPARKAVDYLVESQNESGAWTSRDLLGARLVCLRDPAPVDDAIRDEMPPLPELAWQIQAIKSGLMAGLPLPTKTFNRTVTRTSAFLDARASDDGSRYAPIPGEDPTVEMTAAALLCRAYLGWGRRHPAMARGVPRLFDEAASARTNAEHRYLISLLFSLSGRKEWPPCAAEMRKFLVEQQDRGEDPRRAHQKGSWSPNADVHGEEDGRLVVTALTLLWLELPVRLPLYRRE
jgi:hypothetical protein